MREEGVGRAVELRDRDDVGAHPGQVERRIVDRRLARADAQGLDAALERRDPALQHVGGGVADARVAIALRLQIEEGRAVVRAVERIGDGLVDRHRDRFGRRIALVPAMDRDGFVSHTCTSESRSASRVISRTT